MNQVHRSGTDWGDVSGDCLQDVLTSSRYLKPSKLFRLLALTTLCLFLLLFDFVAHSHAAPPPNVVLIVSDDLGYSDLKPWGGVNPSPTIEKLAREGIVFKDFHATPYCTPTRASMQTGRYNQRTGLLYALPDYSTIGLAQSEVTLAEVLKPVGYHTGLFGKWHLGVKDQFHPMRQGYDEFFGVRRGQFDHVSHMIAGTLDWWDGYALVPTPGYDTTVLTDKAVDFIRRNKAAPFLLVVTYLAVHVPWQGPNDPAGYSNAAHYGQMITAQDEGIGRIMGELRADGLDRNTLVLFMSDNGGYGPGTNAPFRGVKGEVYEGGIRVPLLAWWPGHIPARTSWVIGHVIDLLPTLAAVAGAPLPAGRTIDGRSLLPVLTGLVNGLPARRLFWSQGGNDAVRDGRWKLVVVNGQTELYDLWADKREAHNVATSNPALVGTLQAALAAWKVSTVTSSSRRAAFSVAP